jgi:hypothetical protein
MTRRLRIALAALLLMLASAAPPSRLDAQEPPAAPAAPAGPASASPRKADPLDEFVPHEKVEADSVVAFPVDI